MQGGLRDEMMVSQMQYKMGVGERMMKVQQGWLRW